MRELGARLLSAVGLQDCRRALGPGVNCDVGAEVVLVLADDLAQRDLGNLVNGRSETFSIALLTEYADELHELLAL